MVLMEGEQGPENLFEAGSFSGIDGAGFSYRIDKYPQERKLIGLFEP